MQEPSIFTKIINGDIPSYKIYEDDTTYAFLDIYPIQAGQVLVIPKKQVSFIWDLDQDEYRSLMDSVQKVGRKIRDAFPDKNRVGVMVEGLDVANHAHVKVFPFNNNYEYRNTPDHSVEPDHNALSAIAKRLRI